MVIAGDLYDGDWRDYQTGRIGFAGDSALEESRFEPSVPLGLSGGQRLAPRPSRHPLYVAKNEASDEWFAETQKAMAA
jgi:hypothetical protein